MSVPQLTVYTNGNGAVGADQLNTFEQTCNFVSDLQNFVGVTGQQVFMRGYTAIADGGQGNFYWNAGGTANDGINNIQPNGVSVGCWTRIPGSTGGIVNSIAVGTNAIVLTPISPGPGSYTNYTAYGFIVPNSVNGPVTIQVAGLAALDAYRDDGVTQITTGDYLAGQYVLVVYNSTLNSSAGGFQTISPGYVLNNPTLTGITAAPTPAQGDSTTKIATTQFITQNFPGGYVNRFRNAAMFVTQRGVAGTITAGNPAYTADGWIVSCTGANVTWAINTVSDSTPNAGYPNILSIAGATSVTDTYVKQRIENVDAGFITQQQITIQAVIFNGTGATITPTLTVKNPASANAWGGSLTTILNAVSLQPCLNNMNTVVAYTFTAGVNAAYGLEVTWDFGAALNSSLKFLYFFAPDIRNTPGVTTGLNSTPPPPEFAPLSLEWPRNYRYLYGFGETVGAIATAYATSSSAFGVTIGFKNKMVTAPTGLSVTTAADLGISTMSGSSITTVSSLSSGSCSLDTAFLTGTVSGTGLTQGSSYLLTVKTALAGNVLFTGAEL